jgi:putative transcription antitermination factor YqgF
MAGAASQRVFTVIMAGGASARFWPCDGDNQPKFLIRPDKSGHTLLRMAWERARAVSGAGDVLVVTGSRQAALVASELPELHAANLLTEPARRDTLAAAVLGTLIAQARHPDAIVVVTPADSLIPQASALAAPLKKALAAGAIGAGRLCAFGCKPLRAETGFGWLEQGDSLARGVFEAKRFTEKPDAATAQAYLRGGQHWWNTGSFAWAAADFLAEARRQNAKLVKAVEEYLKLKSRSPAAAATAWESIAPISLDHGVMEGAECLGLLPLDGSFDDIGTWDSLAERGGLASAINGASTTEQQVLLVDSNNCEARGSDVVAFVGCSDLVVVREGNRILVMRRGHGQSVKRIRELEQPARRTQSRTPSASSAQPEAPRVADELPASHDQTAAPTSAKLPGPILAVDFGEVRTGIAVCDDLGLLPVPRDAINGLSQDECAAEIARLCKEERAAIVVLGLPLNMDGSEGNQAAIVRVFGKLLVEAGCPALEYQDERLTTYEAESLLQDAGVKRRNKKGGRPMRDKADSVAAVVILVAWLRARNRQA